MIGKLTFQHPKRRFSPGSVAAWHPAVLFMVVAWLLVGSIGCRPKAEVVDPLKDRENTTPTSLSPLTEVDPCSDDSDPKYLEKLEFGPAVKVPFRRKTLDALAGRPLPPVEVYPWQPRGLVAVLGEHRLRGSLLAVSPDGKRLAITSRGSGFIHIGPTKTLHETLVLTCPAGVQALSWAPGGDTLAVGGNDGVVWIHDVRASDSKAKPLVLDKRAGSGVVVCLSFSADGKYLLGGDNSPKRGIGWVWNVAGRKIIAELVHTGAVSSVAFSPVPGDFRALTGGGLEDGKMHLWNAVEGKELTAVDFNLSKIQQTAVGDIAFSPDGKRALSCHPEMLVRVWDLNRLEKNRELHTYTGFVGGTPLATFSPDGRHIVTARSGDGGVWLWDAGEVKQIRRLTVAAAVYGLQFLSQDQIVCSTTVYNDYNVRLYQTASGQEVQPPQGHLTNLTGVGISPDGGLLATSANDSNGVRLWDLEEVKQRHELQTGAQSAVGFHPAGKQIYYHSVNHPALSFAFVETGKNSTPPYKPDTLHTGGLYSTAITRDGQFALTSGYHDGTVRMWRLNDGVRVRQFNLLNATQPGLVTVAPDMRRALRTGDGTVRLLHLRCQQVKRQWEEAQAWVPFLPDGRAVFFGGADAPVWKISKDEPVEIERVKLNLTGLTTGQFSADGNRLAVVLSGRVAVFDWPSGQLVWEWTPPSHFGGIFGVCLSADGGHLATANGDGTAYVICVDKTMNKPGS